MTNTIFLDEKEVTEAIFEYICRRKPELKGKTPTVRFIPHGLVRVDVRGGDACADSKGGQSKG